MSLKNFQETSKNGSSKNFMRILPLPTRFVEPNLSLICPLPHIVFVQENIAFLSILKALICLLNELSSAEARIANKTALSNSLFISHLYLALFKEETTTEERRPIIEMVTNISIRVKPLLYFIVSIIFSQRVAGQTFGKKFSYSRRSQSFPINSHLINNTVGNTPTITTSNNIRII